MILAWLSSAVDTRSSPGCPVQMTGRPTVLSVSRPGNRVTVTLPTRAAAVHTSVSLLAVAA